MQYGVCVAESHSMAVDSQPGAHEVVSHVVSQPLMRPYSFVELSAGDVLACLYHPCLRHMPGQALENAEMSCGAPLHHSVCFLWLLGGCNILV